MIAGIDGKTRDLPDDPLRWHLRPEGVDLEARRGRRLFRLNDGHPLDTGEREENSAKNDPTAELLHVASRCGPSL
jgi:hypothetical protein